MRGFLPIALLLTALSAVPAGAAQIAAVAQLIFDPAVSLAADDVVVAWLAEADARDRVAVSVERTGRELPGVVETRLSLDTAAIVPQGHYLLIVGITRGGSLLFEAASLPVKKRNLVDGLRIALGEPVDTGPRSLGPTSNTGPVPVIAAPPPTPSPRETETAAPDPMADEPAPELLEDAPALEPVEDVPAPEPVADAPAPEPVAAEDAVVAPAPAKPILRAITAAPKRLAAPVEVDCWDCDEPAPARIVNFPLDFVFR